MSLSRTISEINGDFRRKSQIPPPVFKAPAEGFPLELGTDAKGQKTRMIELSDGQRILDRFSRLDTIPCDGQTRDDSTDRAYA